MRQPKVKPIVKCAQTQRIIRDSMETIRANKANRCGVQNLAQQ